MGDPLRRPLAALFVLVALVVLACAVTPAFGQACGSSGSGSELQKAAAWMNGLSGATWCEFTEAEGPTTNWNNGLASGHPSTLCESPVGSGARQSLLSYAGKAVWNPVANRYAMRCSNPCSSALAFATWPVNNDETIPTMI